jgi:putative ABC transport system permease protein
MLVMDDFLRDLKHALRVLRRNPGFAATVLVTLAIAIGATVTVFSIVDAWLFRPLRFPDAQRLVIAFAAQPNRPTEPAVWLPYREYLEWKARSRSFASISAAFFNGATITTDSDAWSSVGLRVTTDFFRTFGVAPLLGRTLSDADATRPPVVVLSHGLWQRRFGASPAALGMSIRLSDVPHEIVGVMPRDFDMRILDRPEGAEFWTPFRSGNAGYEPGGLGPVAIIGRLKPDVAIANAQKESAAITHEIESAYQFNFNQFVVNISSLQADNTRTVRLTLVVVSAAVLSLLLIAAMNVGTLVLGRGLARTREIAIRAAIGSSRVRLVRQFMTEALVLSVLGGLGGLLLAAVATRLFIAWNPLGTLPSNTIHIDLRALAVTGVVMVVTAILCGLVPAWRASRVDPNDGLRTGGDRGTIAAPGRRAQTAMLIGQLGLSVVLLVATTLLIRTFQRLEAAPLGFTSAGLSVANIVLPNDPFDSSEKRYAFYRQLADRLRALPGVRAVGAGTSAPLNSGAPVTVGRDTDDATRAPRISAQEVSPDFFGTLDIPLIAGRRFDERDGKDALAVVILNARAAADLFGAPARAIGKRVRLDRESWRQVVGVVGNVGATFFNTLEWQTNPIVYRPAAQGFASPASPDSTSFGFTLHVRSDRPLAIADIRNVAMTINSRAAVTDFHRAPDLIVEATRQPAFRMTLLFGFACISLLLATIGAYGLVAQAVAQRVREIAVRVALGAESSRVIGAVMRGTVLAGITGVGLGVMAALMLARMLQGMLYGVDAHDPASFVVASAVLLIAIVVAAAVPARRALRIDPATVLRSE